MAGAMHYPFERDAEQIADRAMRMPDPELAVTGSPKLLNRACLSREEEAPDVRGMPVGTVNVRTIEAPLIMHAALRRSGHSLDAGARAFFEPRSGRSQWREGISAIALSMLRFSRRGSVDRSAWPKSRSPRGANIESWSGR